MKISKIALFTSALFATPCTAKSFIAPQTFPKSANDITFADSMQLQTAGYIPFKDAQIYHEIEIATAGLGQEIEELNAQADLEESAPPIAQQQTNHNDDSVQGIDNTPTPNTTLPDPAPPAPLPSQQNNNYTQSSSTPVNASESGGGRNTEGFQTSQILATQNTTTPLNTNRGCTVYQPNIPAQQQLPLGHPLLKSDWNQRVNSSWFGYRWGGTDFHHGMDLACCGRQYYGKPVFSPADGTVSWIAQPGPQKSCGHGISIKHSNGLRTVYCHLKDAPLYKKGDHVPAGCQIGNVGHTGGRKIDRYPSMGIEMTHLHYEIHYKGSATSITAPDNTRLPIKRGAACQDCIDPTEWINYHFSK